MQPNAKNSLVAAMVLAILVACFLLGFIYALYLNDVHPTVTAVLSVLLVNLLAVLTVKPFMTMWYAFGSNCHRKDAWYIKVYYKLPDAMRPWYCESARVQQDYTTYCKFTRK